MPYFPVDDDSSFHPKVVAAGNAAWGLWSRAGAWAKKHASGGLVPTSIARTMGSRAEIRRLVDVGLWEEVPHVGYVFHDWTDYGSNQPAAEEEEARDRQRAAARDRKRRQRDKERDSHDVTERDNEPPERDSHDETDPVTSRAIASPVPVPELPGLGASSSVPETSRDDRTDEQQHLDDREYIDRAMRLRVDFRKAASRFRDQAGFEVPPAVVWVVVTQILSRATARPGDRTGLVLTSLRDDWAEWEQLAYTAKHAEPAPVVAS